MGLPKENGAKFKGYCNICDKPFDLRKWDDDYPDEAWTSCYCSIECHETAKQQTRKEKRHV